MGGAGILLPHSGHCCKDQICTVRRVRRDGLLRQMEGKCWIISQLGFNGFFSKQERGFRVSLWSGRRFKIWDGSLVISHASRIDDCQQPSIREAIKRITCKAHDSRGKGPTRHAADGKCCKGIHRT